MKSRGGASSDKIPWLKYLLFMAFLPVLWPVTAIIAYADPMDTDADKVPHLERWKSAVNEMRTFSSDIWGVIRHRRAV